MKLKMLIFSCLCSAREVSPMRSESNYFSQASTSTPSISPFKVEYSKVLLMDFLHFIIMHVNMNSFLWYMAREILKLILIFGSVGAIIFIAATSIITTDKPTLPTSIALESLSEVLISKLTGSDYSTASVSKLAGAGEFEKEVEVFIDMGKAYIRDNKEDAKEVLVCISKVGEETQKIISVINNSRAAAPVKSDILSVLDSMRIITERSMDFLAFSRNTDTMIKQLIKVMKYIVPTISERIIASFFTVPFLQNIRMALIRLKKAQEQKLTLYVLGENQNKYLDFKSYQEDNFHMLENEQLSIHHLLSPNFYREVLRFNLINVLEMVREELPGILKNIVDLLNINGVTKISMEFVKAHLFFLRRIQKAQSQFNEEVQNIDTEKRDIYWQKTVKTMTDYSKQKNSYCMNAFINHMFMSRTDDVIIEPMEDDIIFYEPLQYVITKESTDAYTMLLADMDTTEKFKHTVQSSPFLESIIKCVYNFRRNKDKRQLEAQHIIEIIKKFKKEDLMHMQKISAYSLKLLDDLQLCATLFKVNGKHEVFNQLETIQHILKVIDSKDFAAFKENISHAYVTHILDLKVNEKKLQVIKKWVMSMLEESKTQLFSMRDSLLHMTQDVEHFPHNIDFITALLNNETRFNTIGKMIIMHDVFSNVSDLQYSAENISSLMNHQLCGEFSEIIQNIPNTTQEVYDILKMFLSNLQQDHKSQLVEDVQHIYNTILMGDNAQANPQNKLLPRMKEMLYDICAFNLNNPGKMQNSDFPLILEVMKYVLKPDPASLSKISDHIISKVTSKSMPSLKTMIERLLVAIPDRFDEFALLAYQYILNKVYHKGGSVEYKLYKTQCKNFKELALKYMRDSLFIPFLSNEKHVSQWITDAIIEFMNTNDKYLERYKKASKDELTKMQKTLEESIASILMHVRESYIRRINMQDKLQDHMANFMEYLGEEHLNKLKNIIRSLNDVYKFIEDEKEDQKYKSYLKHIDNHIILERINQRAFNSIGAMIRKKKKIYESKEVLKQEIKDCMIKNIMYDLTDCFVENPKKMGQNAVAIIKDLTKEVIIETGRSVMEKVGTIGKRIKEKTPEIIETGRSVMEKVGTVIKETTTKVIQKVGNGCQVIKEKSTKLMQENYHYMESACETIRGVGKSFQNGYKSVIGAISNTYQSVKKSVKAIMPKTILRNNEDPTPTLQMEGTTTSKIEKHDDTKSNRSDSYDSEGEKFYDCKGEEDASSISPASAPAIPILQAVEGHCGSSNNMANSKEQERIFYDCAESFDSEEEDIFYDCKNRDEYNIYMKDEEDDNIDLKGKEISTSNTSIRHSSSKKHDIKKVEEKLTTTRPITKRILSNWF